VAVTYEPIATTTLTSAASSVTFSSISSAYTDIVVICTGKVVSGINNTYIRFNSDATGSYSWINMFGTGSSASSNKSAMSTQGILFDDILNNVPNADIIHIFNYASTNMKKSILRKSSAHGSSDQMGIGVWNNTAAINEITLRNPSANLAIGNTYTLYGIKAA
jgi:hypothetical protein